MDQLDSKNYQSMMIGKKIMIKSKQGCVHVEKLENLIKNQASKTKNNKLPRLFRIIGI